jgi:hypothetical protein
MGTMDNVNNFKAGRHIEKSLNCIASGLRTNNNINGLYTRVTSPTPATAKDGHFACCMTNGVPPMSTYVPGSTSASRDHHHSLPDEHHMHLLGVGVVHRHLGIAALMTRG